MAKVIIAQTKEQRDDAFYIRKKVFVEEQNVPLHIELDEFDLESTHFVLYEKGEPIGAGRIRLIDETTGKIERISILPQYRGRNFGKLIMEEVEKEARSHRLQKLKLNAQIHAIPFYEKLGYVVTSPEFLDADIVHRAMEKNLTD